MTDDVHHARIAALLDQAAELRGQMDMLRLRLVRGRDLPLDDLLDNAAHIMRLLTLLLEALDTAAPPSH